MSKTDVSNLTQLGGATVAFASPEEAILERVPASHQGTDYVVAS